MKLFAWVWWLKGSWYCGWPQTSSRPTPFTGHLSCSEPLRYKAHITFWDILDNWAFIHSFNINLPSVCHEARSWTRRWVYSDEKKRAPILPSWSFHSRCSCRQVKDLQVLLGPLNPYGIQGWGTCWPCLLKLEIRTRSSWPMCQLLPGNTFLSFFLFY